MSKGVVGKKRASEDTHDFAIDRPISIVCAEHVLCGENRWLKRCIMTQGTWKCTSTPFPFLRLGYTVVRRKRCDVLHPRLRRCTLSVGQSRLPLRALFDLHHQSLTIELKRKTKEKRKELAHLLLLLQFPRPPTQIFLPLLFFLLFLAFPLLLLSLLFPTSTCTSLETRL